MTLQPQVRATRRQLSCLFVCGQAFLDKTGIDRFTKSRANVASPYSINSTVLQGGISKEQTSISFPSNATIENYRKGKCLLLPLPIKHCWASQHGTRARYARASLGCGFIA